MNKNKGKKKIILLILIGIVVGISVVGYYWFMPHRNVQKTSIDFKLSASELVEEYLSNAQEANRKYLQADGESKVLAVTGTISSIDEDMNNQKVVYLETSREAKVSCTFTKETNTSVTVLKKGDLVTVKGVIRAGASYDEDLEMYEDVIMEKCDIISE